MKRWYLAAENAARDAIKELGLTTKGNKGGWRRIFDSNKTELWRGHGYPAAWPWLKEQFADVLAPLPLVGQVFMRRVCCECGKHQFVEPFKDPESCSCGSGTRVYMCGYCRGRPALPGRLICEFCATNLGSKGFWEIAESTLRDHIIEWERAFKSS